METGLLMPALHKQQAMSIACVKPNMVALTLCNFNVPGSAPQPFELPLRIINETPQADLEQIQEELEEEEAPIKLEEPQDEYEEISKNEDETIFSTPGISQDQQKILPTTTTTVDLPNENHRGVVPLVNGTQAVEQETEYEVNLIEKMTLAAIEFNKNYLKHTHPKELTRDEIRGNLFKENETADICSTLLKLSNCFFIPNLAVLKE